MGKTRTYLCNIIDKRAVKIQLDSEPERKVPDICFRHDLVCQFNSEHEHFISEAFVIICYR